MRSAVADALDIPLENVRIITYEASGCYGRNGSDLATVDAALMSQLTGHPVRVQWMRHDEHGWDPKGPATVHQLRGGLDANGEIVGWDHEAWIPAFFETTVIGSVLAGRSDADAVPPPVGGPDPLRHPRQPPARALPGRHRLGRERRRRPDLRLDPLTRAAAG